MRYLFACLILIFILYFACPLNADQLEYLNSFAWTDLNDVHIEGDYAYCASGGGLIVFNVSNPSVIRQVGHLFTEGPIYSIDIRDSLIYIAASDHGLVIADISNPTSPEIIGSCIDPQVALIEVNGDYAYTVCADTWPYPESYLLRIFNISDASNPFAVGEISFDYEPASISVMNDIVYIVERHFWGPAPTYGGLRIIPVADPANPVDMGRFEATKYAKRVLARNDYIYFLDNAYGLQIMQLWEDGWPYRIGLLPSDTISFYMREFAIEDNYAYCMYRFSDCIFDISNPQDGDLVGQIAAGSELRDIAVQGDLAINIDNNLLLRAIDIADPAQPSQLDTYNTGSSIYDIDIHENYLFAATYASGFFIYDITDPLNPERLWISETSHGYGEIAANGNLALTAGIHNPPSDMFIFDISDPQEPEYLSTYDISPRPDDILINGAYVYLSRGSSGIEVVDISDPQIPVFHGAITDIGAADALHEYGQYLYVAAGEDGLTVLNISDPASPYLAGSFFQAECDIRDVAVVDSFAYLANNENGILVINVANPENMSVLAQISTDEPAAGVTLIEDHLVVDAVQHGIFLYDISDPAIPQYIAQYQTPGYTDQAIAHDGLLYVADHSSIIIFSLTPTGIEPVSLLPAAFSLSPNYPNPFNARTTIRYSLPPHLGPDGQASPVTLDIYDLLGRRVQTLHNGPQLPGEHSLIWNADGFSSGVYFYKLTAGEFERTEKMMLVK